MRYNDPQSCYEQNRVACHQWANFYNQMVAVSLDRFLKIALDDADRSMRARVRCAGFGAAGDGMGMVGAISQGGADAAGCAGSGERIGG